ncbi:MAG: hypothetical protein JXP73_20420, partial [Deltaproteobacteria bacterium]|nr:hypothetical protein [Deltaproteobacteria bacterium]
MHREAFLVRSALLSGLLCLCAATCGSPSTQSQNGESGGASTHSSTGGTTGSGGQPGTGGTTGSGGDSGSGGAVGSGGTTASGGHSASGGVTGSGGTTASGGRTVEGGAAGSGGMTASGGRPGSGGRTGRGGNTGPRDAGAAGAGGTTGAATGGAGGGTVIEPTECSSGTAQAGDVTVNLSALQQKISGFGVSSAWAGNFNDPNKDPDTLWSTTTGAGLTLHRIRIGGGTTSETKIAQKAVTYGVKVWAAPWEVDTAYTD